MLGCYPQLEDELTNFSTAGYVGDSPNRADAMIWALTDLLVQPMSNTGLFEFVRCMALGIPIGPPRRRRGRELRSARVRRTLRDAVSYGQAQMTVSVNRGETMRQKGASHVPSSRFSGTTATTCLCPN